jgi:hypothetical protein
MPRKPKLLNPGPHGWFVWRHGKQWEAWDGKHYPDMPVDQRDSCGQFVQLLNGRVHRCQAFDVPTPPLDQLRATFAYRALTGEWPKEELK